VLGLSLVVACGRAEKPAAAVHPGATAADDAALLGAEIFDVVDQVMSYRSSHFGHWPGTLREVGVDSLTRSTIRRYSLQGATPVVTAVFRSQEGHQVAACHASGDIQEEASLNGGAFTVACTLTGGGETDFKVQGNR
jgi:hypothetical protein